MPLCNCSPFDESCDHRGPVVTAADRKAAVALRALDRWTPCPDHRDKIPAGMCSVCYGERQGKHTLQARVTALEGALRKYGRHDPLCSVVGGYSYPCTCGFDKTLAPGAGGTA